MYRTDISVTSSSQHHDGLGPSDRIIRDYASPPIAVPLAESAPSPPVSTNAN